MHLKRMEKKRERERENDVEKVAPWRMIIERMVLVKMAIRTFMQKTLDKV